MRGAEYMSCVRYQYVHIKHGWYHQMTNFEGLRQGNRSQTKHLSLDTVVIKSVQQTSLSSLIGLHGCIM